MLSSLKMAFKSTALIVLISSVPLAVHAGAKKTAGSASARSSTTFHTFPGPPTVAVSAHGNLVRFEGPSGYDHLGVGAFSEGYVLCYGTARAYDTGSSETGFATGTANCSGNTCTFIRKTSDNKMQLKQVIKFDKSIRQVSFDMSVTNLTGGSITNVILRRQADFDVDTGGVLGTGDFRNWFGASEFDTVFGWNPANDSTGEGHAVVLTVKTPKQAIAKVTESILDNSCNPTNIAANGPVFGDYGVTLQHNLGVFSGGSTKTVTMRYTRN